MHGLHLSLIHIHGEMTIHSGYRLSVLPYNPASKVDIWFRSNASQWGTFSMNMHQYFITIVKLVVIKPGENTENFSTYIVNGSFYVLLFNI